MKLHQILMSTFLLAYGIVVFSTLWWTVTGHCCGAYIPLITDNADDCLPAQDRQWFVWIGDTHCDTSTWKRVPNKKKPIDG